MIDYLPTEMQIYGEFIQIANAEQKAKDKMWNALDSTFAEGFVSTETEIGASRWEKTLGITPRDNEDIEVRNFRIRGKIQSDLPYTIRVMQRQLIGLCGAGNYSVSLNHDTATLHVKVALSRRELKNEVINLLDEIVPAHLMLEVELMYNTHLMIARAGKTHAELALLTHEEIKEHPFE